jgi:hypothetical protein
MGVPVRIEAREQLAHLMAAEALPLAGSKCAEGRVHGYELRVGGELVAGITVELLFIWLRLQRGRMEARGHATQSDPDIVG